MLGQALLLTATKILFGKHYVTLLHVHIKAELGTHGFSTICNSWVLVEPPVIWLKSHRQPKTLNLCLSLGVGT